MPDHPEVSRRISYIYKTYYGDASSKKFSHMYQECQLAVGTLGLDMGKYVYWVDKHRIGEIISSYYYDVIKYKEYHFNPKSTNNKELVPTSLEFLESIHEAHQDPKLDRLINSAKVAAFTAKWLLRYLPIFIIPKPRSIFSPEEKQKFLSANINFTLDHCLGLMKREAYLLPRETVTDLLYHFKCRTIDDRSLILAFSILARS